MQIGNLTLEQISKDLWSGSLPGISITIEKLSGYWCGCIRSNAFSARIYGAGSRDNLEGVRKLTEVELRVMLNTMRSVCEESQ